MYGSSQREPFKRFDTIPFGGRSTAIKMKSGDVWVLASTPLNDVTKSKLAELGPVKWIIGADAVHYLYLGEFKKEYPDAKVIAVEAAKASMKDGPAFDGAWGADPPETKYGFESDVQHCYFSGFKNKDYSKTGSSGSIPFLSSFVNPTSWAQKHLSWSLGVDKEAMKRDVKTTMGWDFERIIPCHGDVIEKNAKEAWRSAFQYFLD
ncbi:hypothetical protein EIP91_000464 [Steccherinum ochraceum]|uniref:Uncharacterized protein n=1 Tax=Steccherinum ochraceum TaxID=92696 RepID=A0A4R0RW96_9APHY|nr:hypothetical protein EIP91_000464 [Steccherinum ochraceum]